MISDTPVKASAELDVLPIVAAWKASLASSVRRLRAGADHRDRRLARERLVREPRDARGSQLRVHLREARQPPSPLPRGGADEIACDDQRRHREAAVPQEIVTSRGKRERAAGPLIQTIDASDLGELQLVATASSDAGENHRQCTKKIHARQRIAWYQFSGAPRQEMHQPDGSPPCTKLPPTMARPRRLRRSIIEVTIDGGRSAAADRRRAHPRPDRSARVAVEPLGSWQSGYVTIDINKAERVPDRAASTCSAAGAPDSTTAPGPDRLHREPRSARRTARGYAPHLQLDRHLRHGPPVGDRPATSTCRRSSSTPCDRRRPGSPTPRPIRS